MGFFNVISQRLFQGLKYSSMKILITGGAGFIGSHLCHRLHADGHEIFCLDNFFTGRRQNIFDLIGKDRFTLLKQDVCSSIDLTGLDRIYNLACPASPPAYQKDPISTFKTSIWGIENVLELSRKNGNIPVLQASTSEVYGDPLVHPQIESYWGNVNPIGIRSCYDEGKRGAETLMMDYYRTYQTPIRIIRIFNTYGPNMDPQDGRVVSNFINQALFDQDITIYGDGLQTRSFQFVSDLIEGMIRMMENQENFVGPLNLGNPEEYTMIQLAELILSLIPKSSSKIIKKPLPKDDPKLRKPDISIAKQRLGWEPKVNVQDGLKETIEYFRYQTYRNT